MIAQHAQVKLVVFSRVCALFSMAEMSSAVGFAV
jgi:hypothetical protein